MGLIDLVATYIVRSIQGVPPEGVVLDKKGTVSAAITYSFPEILTHKA